MHNLKINYFINLSLFDIFWNIKEKILKVMLICVKKFQRIIDIGTA